MKMTMIIGCRACIFVINSADNAYTSVPLGPIVWYVQTLRKAAPGVYIDGDEAEFGNPMLKPLESSNFRFGCRKVFWQSQYGGFLRIL